MSKLGFEPPGALPTELLGHITAEPQIFLSFFLSFFLYFFFLFVFFLFLSFFFHSFFSFSFFLFLSFSFFSFFFFLSLSFLSFLSLSFFFFFLSFFSISFFLSFFLVFLSGVFLNLLTNWLLRNPEVHYRPYMSLQLNPILSRSMQSPSSQPTSLKPIVIFSHLSLHKDLFPSGLPTKTLSAFLDCSIRSTCPADLSRLDLRLLIMFSEEYNACSSAICNFFHSPVISSPLTPNIFLSTLFSNTLNLCYSLKVREQVSQP